MKRASNNTQALQQEILELEQAAQFGIDSIAATKTYVDLSSLNQTIKSALQETQRKIDQLENHIETQATQSLAASSSSSTPKERKMWQDFITEHRHTCKQLYIKHKQVVEQYMARSKTYYERQQRELLFPSSMGNLENGGNGKINNNTRLLGKPSSSSSASQLNYHHTSSLVQQSKSVTESLSRTRQVLSTQLTRMSNSMISLSTQRETMAKAFDEHEDIASQVNVSKKLITWLQLKEKWDHYATIAAFCLFALVCLNIVNKRVFPFWNIFWYCVSSVFNFLVQIILLIVPSSGSESSTSSNSSITTAIINNVTANATTL